MRKADNLTVVMKSGNLNFLEPSGPLQACNGTALTLLLFCWLFLHCGGFTVDSYLRATNCATISIIN